MNKLLNSIIFAITGISPNLLAEQVVTIGIQRDAYRNQLIDLRNRVEDRDAGVVPGRGSGLPSPAFLGVQDYGEGVTREDALNYRAIKVPGMGLMLSRPEKSGPVKVTRTSDGRHLFDFDVRGLQFPPVATNENGVGYGGGEIKFGASVN